MAMSAIGTIADITFCIAHVTFDSKADKEPLPAEGLSDKICQKKTVGLVWRIGCAGEISSEPSRLDLLSSLVVRAEQAAMPVIGFLDPTSLDKYAPFVEAFRNGLREVGLIEGQNLAIEFRWAEGDSRGCRRWLLTWCSTRSPSLLQPALRRHALPRQRLRPSRSFLIPEAIQSNLVWSAASVSQVKM